MIFASLSYLFSFLLILGGLLCLILGFKLVRSRTRPAQSKSTFSGKLGGAEFTIGAGSLAALSMAMSILWVAGGVYTKPKLAYAMDGDGETVQVSAIKVPRATDEHLQRQVIPANKDAAMAAAAREDTWRQSAREKNPLTSEREELAQLTAAASTTQWPEEHGPELRLITSPSPRYPAEALRSGTQGEVLVEMTVGTDGKVSDAKVVRSNPGQVFDQAALDAVARWKFEPTESEVKTRRTLAFRATPSEEFQPR